MCDWIDVNAEPFAPGASKRTLDRLGTMVLGCSRRIAVDFQRVIAEADWRRQIAALDLPVTVIHGDRDASPPIDLTGRRFAALIPGSELVVDEGGAHGLMVTHGPAWPGHLVAGAEQNRSPRIPIRRIKTMSVTYVITFDVYPDRRSGSGSYSAAYSTR